jgi:hypothetical protein
LGKAKAGAGSVRHTVTAIASNYHLRACRFERNSHFSCTREGAADVPVFGTGIERDQSIAVLAVRLKSVADILRPLSEYL